jgi:hypothetical protein
VAMTCSSMASKVLVVAVTTYHTEGDPEYLLHAIRSSHSKQINRLFKTSIDKLEIRLLVKH